MSETKSTLALEELGRALERLREAIEQPLDNPLAVDGTIQRFELTFELFWKAFKRLLEEEGIQSTTPREALRGAFKVYWIRDEEGPGGQPKLDGISAALQGASGLTAFAGAV